MLRVCRGIYKKIAFLTSGQIQMLSDLNPRRVDALQLNTTLVSVSPPSHTVFLLQLGNIRVIIYLSVQISNVYVHFWAKRQNHEKSHNIGNEI